ncbi:kinase-like domain-containing protein [Umbelopsis sp. AD052]|nr:kinase-like domain-containing protein [Umbelopsis sp. AD052]
MSSPNGSRMRIGQYNIIKSIGVGSFGKVKLAVHSTTGQKVALKIINRKKIASLDMAGRVKREIQYLKLLRHPHIIKLYEVIVTPTDIIMVIEYAGGELFNYIVEKGKMGEDDARRFFQQIICAVEYCHRHKIVHRDLKPENLLLDDNNNVKIADFGLSNIMTDGDFLKTSCGSPNYAAPEVISGKLYAGPEVDVWSCGVILYVMLCGRLPFDDEYIPTLFKKINGGIYTTPSFLSPETKYLLTSMLVVDPLKRITIQEIRQNPWFNVGLPEYLQPLPDTAETLSQEIDESVLSELSKKMGYSRETIYKALSEPDNNQIKVAYQLVVDHHRMIKESEKLSKDNNIESFFATSPPPWNSQFEEQAKVSGYEGNNLEAPSSIAVLSSSLPKGDDSMRAQNRPSYSGQPIMPMSGTPPPGAKSPTLSKVNHRTPPVNRQLSTSGPPSKRQYKARSKWHFGIRSRCPPWEVMLEIFKSLKNVGFEWKVVDPYHLRCRYRYESGVIVKLDLQLYKLDINSYLVDFKSLGQVMAEGHSPQNMKTDSIESYSATSDDMYMVPEEFSYENTLKMANVLSEQADIGSESVLSTFPFLDVCSKLITELAIST